MWSLRSLAIGALCAAGLLAACTLPPAGPPDLTSARWVLLGPLPERRDAETPGIDQDHLAAYGGEATVAAHSGQRMGTLRWTTARAAGGMVDLGEALGSATSSVAYAYTEIRASQAGPIGLKLGSDDGIKVWLNGELVWSNPVSRALEPDQDAVMVNLVRGRNRLLVKVDQAGGEWAFTARLRSDLEEQADWIASPARALAVVVNSDSTAFRVATIPPYAVGDPVTVTVTNPEGTILAVHPTVTGRTTELALPVGSQGVVRLRAAADRDSTVEDGEAIAIVGDRAAVIASAAALARSLRPAEAQPAQTLEYLALILETDAGAATGPREQVDRAVLDVAEIARALTPGPWRADALRGLKDWAYRSSIDGSLQPYTMYLPQGYDPDRRYGLVVALHGYGATGHDIAARVARGEPSDLIIVAPYGRGDMGYRSLAEQDVLDVVSGVKTRYNVDTARVFLVGESMGGMGAWRLGQLYTDQFAALATFGGWTGTGTLGNLRNTPILVVHGDADTQVPIALDRAAVAMLREEKAPLTYTELHGVGHDAWAAWTEDTGPEQLYGWLRGQTLDPWPVEIDFTVENVAYGRHFWVRVDELAWPGASTIRVQVDSNRSIRVSTANTRAFALDLGHPGLAPHGMITISVDGRAFEAPAGTTEVLFHRDAEDLWVMPRINPYSPPVPSKLARHTDGGYLDLFTGPLTIVYGTLNPERAELLRASALSLSDWSPTDTLPTGVKIGRFRVRADYEVTLAEMQGGNLLLLGDANENALSGAALARMPLWWGNGTFSVAGKSVRGTALLAVHLNQDGQGYRTAVLTLPPGLSRADRSLSEAIRQARRYGVDESATRSIVHPDVVVFDELSALAPGGNAVWTGVWDRNWANLREVP